MIKGHEVPAYLGAKKMSLHQTGFQEVLALAHLMGQAPKEIILIGCQPQDLSDYGGSLTDIVKAQIPHALDLAVACLRDWGVSLTPRQSLIEGTQVDALSMERYEAERPSAESACRIGRGETRWIDCRLVGDVYPQDWVLVLVDAAREIIDANRAQEINSVLD
ncbi:unnamed protein product, partial [Darwinula stevensoni]